MVNDHVTYKLAKLLNNTIFSDLNSDYYAAEDVDVTYDNYLGVTHYKEGDLITEGDNIHGKYYYAPYLSEVLDKLLEIGIVIEFEPCFTFALTTHVGYYYKVYKINEEETKLDLLFEDQEWFSSRYQALYDIITRLIEENIITV